MFSICNSSIRTCELWQPRRRERFCQMEVWLRTSPGIHSIWRLPGEWKIFTQTCFHLTPVTAFTASFAVTFSSGASFSPGLMINLHQLSQHLTKESRTLFWLFYLILLPLINGQTNHSRYTFQVVSAKDDYAFIWFIPINRLYGRLAKKATHLLNYTS